MDDVIDAVDAGKPGDEVELTVLRRRRDQDGTVTGRPLGRPARESVAAAPSAGARAPAMIRTRTGASRGGHGRVRTLELMRVKICGITNLEDAAEAVRLGAWAIGLIHCDESPRRCRAREAAAICAAFRRKCEVVGVFVNPTLDEVARRSRALG